MRCGRSGQAGNLKAGNKDDERYSGGADVALQENLWVAVEALGAAALRVRIFEGGCKGEDKRTSCRRAG